MGELALGVDLGDAALEPGFEVLVLGERLSPRVHLDVEGLGRAHIPNRQEVERDRRGFGRCQAGPRRLEIGAGEALVDVVKHRQHRLDRRIVAPGILEPRLVANPCRRIHSIGGQDVRDQTFAEKSSAWAGRVAECRPCLTVERDADFLGDVPVQEEERGQPLLTIEGTKCAVFGNDIAVDEIQLDGNGSISDEG